MGKVKKNKLLILTCVLMLLIITTTVCLVSCVKPKKGETVIYNNYNITVPENAGTYRYAVMKAIESAVHIKATLKGNNSFNSNRTITILSSGTIITNNGYLLTNNHSVSYSGYTLDTLNITTFDQDYNETSYTAELVSANETHELDLAVLKINNAGNRSFTPATVSSSDELKMGEKAFMLGESAGTGFMLSNAVISHPKSSELAYLEEGFSELVKINANVNQGMTVTNANTALFRIGYYAYIGGGSGLYDIKGNLVGMVSYRKEGKDSNAENLVMGIGYAIQTEDIQEVLTENYNGISLKWAEKESVE